MHTCMYVCMYVHTYITFQHSDGHQGLNSLPRTKTVQEKKKNHCFAHALPSGCELAATVGHVSPWAEHCLSWQVPAICRWRLWPRPILSGTDSFQIYCSETRERQKHEGKTQPAAKNIQLTLAAWYEQGPRLFFILCSTALKLEQKQRKTCISLKHRRVFAIAVHDPAPNSTTPPIDQTPWKAS